MQRGGKGFENLTASEIYCPRCRTAQRVRERLLLILPAGELHEYRCATCGESLATRKTARRVPAVAGKLV